MDSELVRYIEYLQRSLLTPDAEHLHNHKHFREWSATNRDRLLEIATPIGKDAASLVDEYQRAAEEFVPATKFDTFSAQGIFGPILDDALRAAREVGIVPTRPIIFSTSTDVSATPASRPSEGEHLLFAGAGTSTFCNYWAKAYTSLIRAFASEGSNRRMTSSTLKNAWAKHPEPLVTAAKLALYYRHMGTLIGFGEMKQPADYYAYRMELLFAMEVFVVAHEIGHFFFEEKNSQPTTAASDPRLELACDAYALAISRACASRRNNWLAFTGGGALLLLRAVGMSDPGSVGEHSPLSATHPPPKERISALVATALDNTATDQAAAVGSYLEELNILSDEIESAVFDALASASKMGQGESEP